MKISFRANHVKSVEEGKDWKAFRGDLVESVQASPLGELRSCFVIALQRMYKSGHYRVYLGIVCELILFVVTVVLQRKESLPAPLPDKQEARWRGEEGGLKGSYDRIIILFPESASVSRW